MKKKGSRMKSCRLWGLTLNIDLYDCDKEIINSSDKINQYVLELCQLIEMTPFGDTIIQWFGQEKRVEGYSMIQLIETSSITAHFANETNAAYIDIFSCKYFDVNKATEFSFNYFKAKQCSSSILHRK